MDFAKGDLVSIKKPKWFVDEFLDEEEAEDTRVPLYFIPSARHSVFTYKVDLRSPHRLQEELAELRTAAVRNNLQIEHLESEVKVLASRMPEKTVIPQLGTEGILSIVGTMIGIGSFFYGLFQGQPLYIVGGGGILLIVLSKLWGKT